MAYSGGLSPEHPLFVLTWWQEITALSQPRERCKRSPHMSNSSWLSVLGFELFQAEMLGCECSTQCLSSCILWGKEETSCRLGLACRPQLGSAELACAVTALKIICSYKIYNFLLAWFDVGCVGITDHILKVVSATGLNVGIHKSQAVRTC